jgi:hypothetical protein
MGRYDSLVEQIRTIDTNNIENWDEVSNPISNVIEKQQVYIWIRLYLKEESSNIQIGDDISMVYKPSGEKLLTKFICYDKTTLNKDHDDMEKVINFNPEDDKKVLCLMADEEIINKGENIPFIKTLFKTSRHYQYQLVRRDDLVFINDRINETLEYFDCSY